MAGTEAEMGVFFQTEERRKALPRGVGDYEAGLVVGEYRLVRKLGQGGMGSVWEAEQLKLSRRVAVKLVHPERLDERGIEFFEREARANARTAHPGLVQIFDAGVSEGIHYIVLELVEGECTFADSLRQLSEAESLPPDYYRHLAGFFGEVADAMQAAHDSGVIHRDLKPQNLLVTPDDHPKVTDFGLARVVSEASLSMTGDFAGTYYYMSPEQVAARRIGVDHRTDIFSLGAILYEALALSRPFQGDTSHQIAEKILYQDPPAPRVVRSQVPPDLATICMKCLAKRREHRFQTMREVAEELRRFLRGEPILSRPAGPLRRAVSWVQRHPGVSASVLGTTIALVAISVLYARNLQASENLRGLNDELLEKTTRLMVLDGEVSDRATKISLLQLRIKDLEEQTDSLDERRKEVEMLQAELAHLQQQAEEALNQRDELTQALQEARARSDEQP